MDFIEKLKTRLIAVKDAAVVEAGITLVPDQIKEERLTICRSCEFLFEPTLQCKRCGCFLKLKTSFAFFKCPVDKWHDYLPDADNP